MRRGPFQGVWTVVRFNWHLYAVGLGAVVAFLGFSTMASGVWGTVFWIAASGSAAGLVVPILATWYAYDATGLYDLSWMSRWLGVDGEGANIHAGFDETTLLLEARYPGVRWHVYDFYDASRHTEISIRRARKAQVPHPKTVLIRSTSIPLGDKSLDTVVLMMSAHEVRDRGERVVFFREISRVLREGGTVLVIEHLRDWANVVSYSIGAWHFHSRREWLATFEQAGFVVGEEVRLNGLITTFVLVHRENAP